jgi:protein SCO1/2
MVCTPTGRVSRYLHGVLYDPRTLKLSLVEASEGRIGTKLDQLVLYCFHYDETAGRYGPAAVRIMQVGGGTTLAVLLAILLPVWLRGLRRRPEPAAR